MNRVITWTAALTVLIAGFAVVGQSQAEAGLLHRNKCCKTAKKCRTPRRSRKKCCKVSCCQPAPACCACAAPACEDQAQCSTCCLSRRQKRKARKNCCVQTCCETKACSSCGQAVQGCSSCGGQPAAAGCSDCGGAAPAAPAAAPEAAPEAPAGDSTT